MTPKLAQPDQEPPTPALPAAAAQAIAEAVRGIRYGTVQIVIQDGRIIQIDKTEKIRLA